MSTRLCMVVFDPATDLGGQNAVRILCTEEMAKAIARQPGAEVSQDNEHGYVVLAGLAAGVTVDLHI